MPPVSFALELGANPSKDWARIIFSTGMSNIFIKIEKVSSPRESKGVSSYPDLVWQGSDLLQEGFAKLQ